MTNHAIYAGPAYLRESSHEFHAAGNPSAGVAVSERGRYHDCEGQRLDDVDAIGDHRPATGAGIEGHMTHA